MGLTASVGTDRAQNVQQVISHILQLCANLDCWSVCTVKIHKAEMLKHCKSTEQGENILRNTRNSFETTSFLLKRSHSLRNTYVPYVTLSFLT